MKITRGAAPFLLCLCAVVCLMAQIGTANVVLMGNNLTFSFDDVEANFGKFWISWHHLALTE
jgi:E3 ubiquitin-protein ligase RNF13